MQINRINSTTNFNGNYTSRFSSAMQQFKQKAFGNKNGFEQAMSPFYRTLQRFPDGSVDIVQRGVVFRRDNMRQVFLSNERNLSMTIIHSITKKLQMLADKAANAKQFVSK